MKKITSKSAPEAIGPYSQAVQSGNFLFVSGQLPINPKTQELLAGDIKEQTRQVMNNIKAIVEEADGTLSNVIKTTILVKDLAQFSEINEAYGEFFGDLPPARATYQVAGLPKGADIEIEAICVL